MIALRPEVRALRTCAIALVLAAEWDFTRWASGVQPRPVLFVNSDDGNACDRIALASAVVRSLQTTRF